MSKRFRCGRLMLTKDGKVKKVDLDKGGGTRFCDWHNNDMDFDDILKKLVNIFNLGDTEYETSLYDFQRLPLDVSKYDTFLEYIYNNGLNCNGTILYLCTREVDSGNQSKTLMKTKENLATTTLTSSTIEQKTSTLIETRSSTTSIEYKHNPKIEPESDHEQNQQLSSEYNFKKSTAELVNNLRNLINEIKSDEIFIQLFEYVCIIHGFIRSTIDGLYERLKQSDECLKEMNLTEIEIYTDTLTHTYNICRLIKKLIKANKDKFDHIENFARINISFLEFYQNIKVLRDKWSQWHNVDNQSYGILSTSYDSIKPKKSISSANIQSLSVHSNEPVASISSSNNRSSLIHSAETVASTSSINIQSSSQDHGETNMQTQNQGNLDSFVLFQHLLNCCADLLFVMHSERLKTFRTMIRTIVDDIRILQSRINLHNYDSLYEAVGTVNSIKSRYTRKFSSDVFTSWTYRITRPIKQVYEKTLTAICDLLKALRDYREQINQTNPTNNLNSSSNLLPITGQQQSENTQQLEYRQQSNKRKYSYNNRQSVVRSNPSFKHRRLSRPTRTPNFRGARRGR